MQWHVLTVLSIVTVQYWKVVPLELIWIILFRQPDIYISLWQNHIFPRCKWVYGVKKRLVLFIYSFTRNRNHATITRSVGKWRRQYTCRHLFLTNARWAEGVVIGDVGRCLRDGHQEAQRLPRLHDLSLIDLFYAILSGRLEFEAISYQFLRWMRAQDPSKG